MLSPIHVSGRCCENNDLQSLYQYHVERSAGVIPAVVYVLSVGLTLHLYTNSDRSIKHRGIDQVKPHEIRGE